MRLAERRGLLKGRRLSVVQEFGLELLLRQDNLRDGDREFDQMRMAMLASGKKTIEDLWPEYFPGSEMEMTEDTPEDVFVSPNTEYDMSGVEWQSPSEMAEDELAALEQFLNDPYVTLATPQDDDPDGGGWV